MIPGIFNNQPVAVAGVVSTGIGLAIAFGAPISSEQAGAIMAFTASLSGLVVWHKVSPVGRQFTRKAQPGKHEMSDSD